MKPSEEITAICNTTIKLFNEKQSKWQRKIPEAPYPLTHADVMIESIIGYLDVQAKFNNEV